MTDSTDNKFAYVKRLIEEKKKKKKKSNFLNSDKAFENNVHHACNRNRI